MPRKILGRNLAVRLGRFIQDSGRYDGPNRPDSNGEYALIEKLVGSSAGPLVALDVGAFRGDWTKTLCRAAQARGRSGQIHVFEAFAPSHAQLVTNLESFDTGDCQVHVHNLALGSQLGEVEFFAVGSDAGTNSLVEFDSAINGDRETVTTRVEATTVEHFCAEHGITSVGFIKVDTEGNDLEVIRGCQSLMFSGAIGAIQFEYNTRWIVARHFLRDVFLLIEGTGWRLGKITPDGIEFYAKWHYELETFRECNMLLLGPDTRLDVVELDWWRD